MRRLRQLIAHPRIRMRSASSPSPVDAKWGPPWVENSLWQGVPICVNERTVEEKSRLQIAGGFVPVRFTSSDGRRP